MKNKIVCAKCRKPIGILKFACTPEGWKSEWDINRIVDHRYDLDMKILCFDCGEEGESE